MHLGKSIFSWLLMAGALLLPYQMSAPALAAVAVDVVQENGQTEEIDLYSSSHALVIGIDQYSEGWPLLSNAVKDANAVAAALEARGFEVTLKVNLNRNELVAALRSFFIIKGDDPEARLFLWFAGHGHTENNEGFIIPADGAVPEEGAKFRISAIPMRDVSTYVRLAQSKHVLTIFDSCFSGTVFDTSRSKPSKVISMASTRPVRQFLTSGDAYQQVSDDGTFRELFLGALDGEEAADLNNDGYITGTELGFFMTIRMTNLTEGRQTPRYGKLRDKEFDRGDYIFTSLRKKAPRIGERQSVSPDVPNQQRYSPELETAFWTSIQGSDDWQDYQAYIDRFGDQGAFTGLAKRRVNRLKAADEASKSASSPSIKTVDVVEQAYWDSVKDSNDWQDYQFYIDKYGQGGAFFPLAWQRYGQLRSQENQTSAAAPEQEVAALPPEVVEAPVVTAPEIINSTPAPEQPELSDPVIDPDVQYKAQEARLRLSRRDRQNIQQALTSLGHSTRGVDGLFGRNSRRAISAYQRRKGLEPTGYLDGNLRRGIIAEAPPPPPPPQQAQSETQLAAMPPQTSEPAPRISVSGNNGQWHITAKITGTTTCGYVPTDFEGDIAVSGYNFHDAIQNSSGSNLNIKGRFRGSDLEISGIIDSLNPVNYVSSANWRFSTNIIGTSVDSYNKTVMTTRIWPGCGLRVNLSMKRKN